MNGEDNIGPERTRLNFANAVHDRFQFLRDLGFLESESSPTMVRYRKADLEVDIYHGRKSFEIGFEVIRHGIRYSLSELIRAANPDVAEQYRNYAATNAAGVAEGLAKLAKLVKDYCGPALTDDQAFFSTLDVSRKSWAEGYAMDVLARQVRPQADAAFRRGDYHQAVELYSKIRPRLTATELKKLELAQERSGQHQ